MLLKCFPENFTYLSNYPQNPSSSGGGFSAFSFGCNVSETSGDWISGIWITVDGTEGASMTGDGTEGAAPWTTLAEAATTPSSAVTHTRKRRRKTFRIPLSLPSFMEMPVTSLVYCFWLLYFSRIFWASSLSCSFTSFSRSANTSFLIFSSVLSRRFKNAFN
jgi:hypothetical protein